MKDVNGKFLFFEVGDLARVKTNSSSNWQFKILKTDDDQLPITDWGGSYVSAKELRTMTGIVIGKEYSNGKLTGTYRFAFGTHIIKAYQDYFLKVE